MNAGLARIPGTSETTLTAELLARLPAQAPPAPWTARASGIAWWKRPDRTARAALRELLPAALGTGPRPLLTIGAMITYDDTPVGPYSEVLAMIVLRGGAGMVAHVPFIAVDSPDSVAGGRANWALPKTLAEFDGHPGNRATMTAQAPGWHIQATPRTFGPPLPVPLPPLARLVQAGPDGSVWSVRPRGHLRMRLARIDVHIRAAPTMAQWFPTGRCAGMLSTALTGFIPAANRDRDRTQPLS